MKITDYTAGMKIIAPMIVRGMPNEVYHGSEGVSSSYLKEVFKSSIHNANKQRLDMSKKKHFELGGIFHDITEGFTAGYDVMDRYFVYPEYDKVAKQPIIDVIKIIQARYEGLSTDDLSELEISLRGNKRDVLKAMAEGLIKLYAKGKTKISDENLGNAEAMLEAMKEHPEASKWMNLEGESELSFFWMEEVEIDGGIIKILLKIRCDRFIETEDEIFIIDWKSTAFVPTPEQITKERFSYGYDFSASMYRHVVSKFTDKPIHFLHVFVSSTDPVKENVAVDMMFEEDLDIAFEHFQSGLQKYANWGLNGGWTGVERDEDRGFTQTPMRRFYGE